jgi:hypothetical protein
MIVKTSVKAGGVKHNRCEALTRFRTFAVFSVAAFSLAWHPVRVQAADFVRGDVRPDGVIDLSDAVTTFGFLFLGGRSPVCLDSADANDDGRVDISDGIAVLSGSSTAPRRRPSPPPAAPSTLRATAAPTRPATPSTAASSPRARYPTPTPSGSTNWWRYCPTRCRRLAPWRSSASFPACQPLRR